MMLTRYNPNYEIARMLNNFEMPVHRRRAQRSNCATLPAADIWKDSESYYIEMNVPGFSKENIEIKFNDGILSVTGKMNEVSNEDENIEFVRRERRIEDFERRFRISDEIDIEKISAKQNLGVLKLVLPIAETAKPKNIEVNID